MSGGGGKKDLSHSGCLWAYIFDRYFCRFCLTLHFWYCHLACALFGGFSHLRDARTHCLSLTLCVKEMSLVSPKHKNQFFLSYCSYVLFQTSRASFLHSLLLLFLCTLFMLYAMYTYFSPCISGNEKMPSSLLPNAAHLFRVFFLRRSFHELLLPFIICYGRCDACVCMRLPGVVVIKRRNDAGCVCRVPVFCICMCVCVWVSFTVAKCWLEIIESNTLLYLSFTARPLWLRR